MPVSLVTKNMVSCFKYFRYSTWLSGLLIVRLCHTSYHHIGNVLWFVWHDTLFHAIPKFLNLVWYIEIELTSFEHLYTNIHLTCTRLTVNNVSTIVCFFWILNRNYWKAWQPLNYSIFFFICRAFKFINLYWFIMFSEISKLHNWFLFSALCIFIFQIKSYHI